MRKTKRRLRLPALMLTIAILMGMIPIPAAMAAGIVPGKADMETLMENIAAGYSEASGEWEIIGLSAYRQYNPAATETSLSAQQTYINYAVSVIDDYTKSTNGIYANPDTEYSKAIIALQSIGVDAGQVYHVNSLVPLDAFNKLGEVPDSQMASLQYATSSLYVLQAFIQQPARSSAFSSQEQKIIEFLLDSQDQSGAWGYDFGGFMADVDYTAMTITALAPYYPAGGVEIVAAVDAALLWLAGEQNADGTFDDAWGGGASANSTAQVIIALCALGLDPDTYFADSALDSLISFATSSLDGFTGGDPRATLDGFMALIAAARYYQTGNAVNIYDFSSNPVLPARATGAGGTPSITNPPVTNPDITVTVTIKSDTGYWMNSKPVTVKEGSVVYHALAAAVQGSGITVVGAENGYIRSIAYNGVTLAEFSDGANSGWLYKVNDVLMTVGITAYILKNGDRIVIYYSEDWTIDPDAGFFNSIGGGGKAKDDDEEDANEEDSDEAENQLTDSEAWNNPFSDVKESDWFYDAIRYAYENGLMNGTGAGFEPNAALTRAMVVTILARAAGVDTSQGESWYSEAVSWGVANGITNGEYINENITREQLVTMLFRFASLLGIDTSERAELSQYDDMGSVSDWALDAMAWAVAIGLIRGRTETTLAPGGTATRAEAATILQRFLQS